MTGELLKYTKVPVLFHSVSDLIGLVGPWQTPGYFQHVAKVENH
jgi:hypothetical protein